MHTLKIYCEKGALTKSVQRLRDCQCVQLVQFPYDDPSSFTRKIPHIAIPSQARITDLNLPIENLVGVIGDYSGSDHFNDVLALMGVSGPKHQLYRDALHVDSAFKHGCSIFITNDSDILNHRMKLRRLLGIRFFRPDWLSWRVRNWMILCLCKRLKTNQAQWGNLRT